MQQQEYAEMEAQKNAMRAQEQLEAVKETVARIAKAEEEMQNSTVIKNLGEGPAVVLASRMQEYYDEQLVVVQADLDQLAHDEREEYLGREAMKACDAYH